MMLIHGDIATEYGHTPAGQWFEVHRNICTGKVLASRSTPDNERFMRWIIQSEVDKDVENQLRDRKLRVIKCFWTICCGDSIRGTFNQDLYLKIIEAKEKWKISMTSGSPATQSPMRGLKKPWKDLMNSITTVPAVRRALIKARAFRLRMKNFATRALKDLSTLISTARNAD